MAVENIEIETYFGKCKCCLNYGYLRTMWEPHSVDAEKEIYGQMLTQCFCIEWTVETCEEDDQICEDCIWKLREAHTFKTQVLHCQKQLEQSEADHLDNENYDVEYLDEDILDNPKNDRDSSEEESVKDSHSRKESHGEEYSPRRENHDDDEDNDAAFQNDDEDYDPVEDEELITEIVPRKRKPPRKGEESDSSTERPKPKWPKQLPKLERWKTYKQYSEDSMKEAINAVTTKRMNQNLAAKNYNVPRKTLSAKIRAIKNTAENSQSAESDSDYSEEVRESISEVGNTRKSISEDAITLWKHRENIHSMLAYSNATPIRFVGTYVCALCPNKFTDPTELKTHTGTHRNIPKSYRVDHVRSHVSRLDVTDLRCRICGIKIEDLRTMMLHLQEHGKPMHFDIKNHMVPFKFDTKRLECVECGQEFNQFKFLSEHMASTHYRNYVCATCDRGFFCKVNLLSHMDSHKTGNFNCSYCANVFNSRRKKTTHERINHSTKTKTVKCGYCRMHFQNLTQKNYHELTSHRKKRVLYNCNECGSNYASRRSLRDHTKREHLSERPYKCNKAGCDKDFFLKRALQDHKLTHSTKPLFRCKVCLKVYRTPKSLRGHMYTHDERKDKCPKCHKRFVLEENLIKHLKEKH